MGRMARSCFGSLLKLVNSVMGLAGMGMIMYSVWMIRVWYRQTGEFWIESSPPWFMYSFLGLGVIFCLITCNGLFASETANGHCISCYMVFVFLLVMLEAAVTADIFLNRDWEDDFPVDDTGRFDELKYFVRTNFQLCKWIGLGVFAAQVISIFLAIILKALGPDGGSYYDSDEEYLPARLPLLRNQVQHAQYVAAPYGHPHSESWNVPIKV